MENGKKLSNVNGDEADEFILKCACIGCPPETRWKMQKSRGDEKEEEEKKKKKKQDWIAQRWMV